LMTCQVIREEIFPPRAKERSAGSVLSHVRRKSIWIDHDRVMPDGHDPWNLLL
jgi:hypothetical protein